jgi:hypothetical protein
MRNFILDVSPNFSESKVTLGDCEYKLKRIQNNGCYFLKSQNGLEPDQTTLTTTDMRALCLLLMVNDSK